jgi:hypothetical protein
VGGCIFGSSSGDGDFNPGGINQDAGGSDSHQSTGDSSTSAVAPTVTNVGPNTGDYGTVITIDGDNLDGADVKVVLASSGGPITLDKVTGAVLSPLEAKSKNQIQFKYPFPAEGQMSLVSSKGGTMNIGSFVPTWKPGAPLTGKLLRTDLLGAVSPAPNTLVSVFDGVSGPYFVIADGSSIKTVAYERGASALLRANLYVAANGDVGGFFATGTPPQLWQMKLSNGVATTTNTGVTLTATKSFFAGGSDTTGPYAWVRKTAGSIERVRPPTWATDKTVTEPGASTNSVSGGIGPDGTLFMVWGKDIKSLLDDYAVPYAAKLGPAATTFASETAVGPKADDIMIWTRVRGAGPSGQLITFYCASDSGAFASTTVDCKEGYVGLSGTLEMQSATIKDKTVGFDGTKTMSMTCDAATRVLSIGAADNVALQVPALYPCPTQVAVGVDSTGKALVMVSDGNNVYSPRKP